MKKLLSFDRENGIDLWVKQYGEIFGVYFLWVKPSLIVSDAEAVKGKVKKQLCPENFG